MTKPYRLYRIPKKGEKIVVGVDTAEGGDLSTAVFKSVNKYDSFMVLSGHFSSAEFSPLLMRGCRFIQKLVGRAPLVAIERNMGMSTINYFMETDYPNLYRQEAYDSTVKRYVSRVGWVTTTPTRRKMLDELSMAYNEKQTRVYDQATLDQLLTFIRKRKTGKPEAEVGCYDDLVIAEAIAHQVALTARTTDFAGVISTAVPTVKIHHTLDTYNLDALAKDTQRKVNWKGI